MERAQTWRRPIGDHSVAFFRQMTEEETLEHWRKAGKAYWEEALEQEILKLRVSKAVKAYSQAKKSGYQSTQKDPAAPSPDTDSQT